MSDFGRLERVDLRQGWMTEAQHFTPWLAREENLALLADTLGLDLEFEAQERAVGPFRADILCKNTADDSWVLIENQLERTDHSHLGQLITYAAGLHAVTIVWIAARFADEHRAACDWLNEITSENVRIFALEVELWRIGQSPIAPKFNIISQPNDWAKQVATAQKAINDGEFSDTRQTQWRYWKSVEDLIGKANGAIRPVSPQASSWVSHGIGKTGVHFNFAMSRPEKLVRIEVYLSGLHAKSDFAQLAARQAEIEAKLGKSLVWQPMPDKKDARIALHLSDIDPFNEADWDRQHRWIVENAQLLHQVFRPLVMSLNRGGKIAEDPASSEAL